MPNSLQSSAIASPASHKLQSFIHYRTLLPRHHSLPSKGRKCHLCVRYNVLPMSQVVHLAQLRSSYVVTSVLKVVLGQIEIPKTILLNSPDQKDGSRK